MAQGFREFRFGWKVVLASTIGIGFGMSPLPFYTIGVFAIPLNAEFGWGQGDILIGLAVFTGVAFFMAPTIGLIADRIGPRRVVLFSILSFGLSMMAFALNNGSFALYLIIWGALAVFGVGTLPITWTYIVNEWFNERRGLALGVALTGTGLFGAFSKLYAAEMIELVGWRNAYIAVGALPIVIALPIAWAFFRPLDDPKVAKAAAGLRGAVKTDPAVANNGMTLWTALKDWRFWLLAYAFVPVSIAVGGPIPNLERMMLSKGFSGGQEVLLASFIGYSVIVGRILGGYLIDRIWAPAVAFVMLSLPAISCLMLQGPQDNFVYAATAVAILGFAAGVEYDLMAFLVSRYFGLKNYGAIYGFLYAFFAAGAGFGPVIYGKSFERTGSYDTMLMIGAGVLIAGTLPLLLLGKYREFRGEEIITPEKSP